MTASPHMLKALNIASQAMRITSPNPRVGCVIVNDQGKILGQGHTQKAGGLHAEMVALQDAANQGNSVEGATVYVTLEPCAHHGRTGPCCDALIQAKVSKVVAALTDPNPLVAGQGIDRLRAAGIEVEVGDSAHLAEQQNPGFLSRMRRHKPWVRLKMAASLDGQTALQNGQSQWITGPEARADGHAWRARACAVLTGIGTVQQDDPQLNVRAVETPRQPRRIVVDSHLEISPQAKILQGAASWIFSAVEGGARADQLRAEGHELIALPDESGKVDLRALMNELGLREINELHVEAGFKLNGSLLRAGVVDELLLYLAPCLLGPAQGLVRLPVLEHLSDRLAFRFHEVEQVGPDLRLRVMRSTP